MTFFVIAVDFIDFAKSNGEGDRSLSKFSELFPIITSKKTHKRMLLLQCHYESVSGSSFDRWEQVQNYRLVLSHKRMQIKNEFITLCQRYKRICQKNYAIFKTLLYSLWLNIKHKQQAHKTYCQVVQNKTYWQIVQTSRKNFPPKWNLRS